MGGKEDREEGRERERGRENAREAGRGREDKEKRQWLTIKRKRGYKTAGGQVEKREG